MNADTAILLLGVIRNGSYLIDSATLNRGGWNNLWSHSSANSNESFDIGFHSGHLNTELRSSKNYGLGVRREIPSLIFSLEAMGWPRDI